MPRVTLLLLFGLLLGPSGFNLVSDPNHKWFPLITDIALLMVGFLLGGQLTLKNLRRHGYLVLTISLAESAVTAVTVLAGMLAIGVETPMALLLAGIATATAPAATVDVVYEMKARGAFAKTLLGVVAVDDAWGLIIFISMLSAASFLTADASDPSLLLAGLWDLAGAFLLGIGLGIPAAFLTGRIHSGKPTLLEAIGVIFLCGGISILMGVSLLLSAMVMGMTIANLARHHVRPFHEIEHIGWPFMILFFVMAGASLHVEVLLQIGYIGIAYVALRAAGKISGAWVGSFVAKAPVAMRNWLGIALMPQAGIALGMALIAEHKFQDFGHVVLTVVIGAVVIFELAGPILTRLALLHTKRNHS